MKGVPHGQGSQVRNLHNQGNNTNNIELVANVLLASIFVILPYIDALKRHRVVKIFSPSKMIVFTVVAAALVALLHEALDPYGLPSNRSLDSNQSEFEEVLIYYAFLVYFVEKHRQLMSAPELLTKSGHLDPTALEPKCRSGCLKYNVTSLKPGILDADFQIECRTVSVPDLGPVLFCAGKSGASASNFQSRRSGKRPVGRRNAVRRCRRDSGQISPQGR